MSGAQGGSDCEIEGRRVFVSPTDHFLLFICLLRWFPMVCPVQSPGVLLAFVSTIHHSLNCLESNEQG